MSDFVLHFGENFMEIPPKITKLQLITFWSVVGFYEFFRNKIQNIFSCSKMQFSMLLNDFKIKKIV